MIKSFKINKEMSAAILIVFGLFGGLYNMFTIHNEAKEQVLQKYEYLKFNNLLEEDMTIYPDNEYLVAFKLINIIFYLFFVSLVYGRLNKEEDNNENGSPFINWLKK